MDYFGMKIVPHMLAREVRTEFKVARWPLRKKRRNWMVRRIDIDRPGCLRVGDTIYMHPELIAKLPRLKTPNRRTKRRYSVRLSAGLASTRNAGTLGLKL